MSFFGLLFIIFLIWLVPKIIRGYIFVNRIKKQSRQMYEQMYGNPAGRRTDEKKRKPGWSTPTPHRKKIDPNVGEYVSFQEISVSETTQATSDPSTGNSKTSYTVEQQVTDAEWVDIS